MVVDRTEQTNTNLDGNWRGIGQARRRWRTKVGRLKGERGGLASCWKERRRDIYSVRVARGISSGDKTGRTSDAKVRISYGCHRDTPTREFATPMAAGKCTFRVSIVYTTPPFCSRLSLSLYPRPAAPGLCPLYRFALCSASARVLCISVSVRREQRAYSPGPGHRERDRGEMCHLKLCCSPNEI